MKFRDKLARFMYGRYGTDSLNFGLLVLYFLLFIISLFISNKTARLIVSVAMWLCILFPLYRMLSKNHLARARENRLFLKLTGPFKTLFLRIRDIRKKRYRKCTKCKAVLRLPIKKGEHSVKCPKCGNNFKVKIRF